jgi:hypothetical protein
MAEFCEAIVDFMSVGLRSAAIGSSSTDSSSNAAGQNSADSPRHRDVLT